MFGFFTSTSIVLLLVKLLVFTFGVHGHIAAWHKAIFQCGGTSEENNSRPVTPLYNKAFKDWWFHGTNCTNPANAPPANAFLVLPAGGSFTVEMADNKAHTTLVQGGKFVSEWPDGKAHPEGYNGYNNTGDMRADHNGCILVPNLHTRDEQDAAGSAFAISYQNDVSKVTPENLVVFSVRDHTPYKRVAHFDVPKDMPACPAGGCICAWMWVPNHCGLSNMYMIGYRCQVSNVSPTARKLGTPQPAVWCEDDRTKCVKGPKQMTIAFQAEGNNVVLSGKQKDGQPKSPGYNMKMGFADGAQNDIFA